MKKLLTSVCTLFIFLSVASGCAGQPGEIQTFTDPEQVINVSKNQEFYIALVRLDNTGNLRWIGYFDNKMLGLVATTLQSNRDNRTDAGDTDWFTFKALKTGECELRMVYLPWTGEGVESPLRPEKVFTVRIE